MQRGYYKNAVGILQECYGNAVGMLQGYCRDDAGKLWGFCWIAVGMLKEIKVLSFKYLNYNLIDFLTS